MVTAFGRPAGKFGALCETGSAAATCLLAQSGGATIESEARLYLETEARSVAAGRAPIKRAGAACTGTAAESVQRPGFKAAFVGPGAGIGAGVFDNARRSDWKNLATGNRSEDRKSIADEA